MPNRDLLARLLVFLGSLIVLAGALKTSAFIAGFGLVAIIVGVVLP